MSKEIDIRSSTLDKGLEVAKDFIDKLIMPGTEEIGLLIKDRISLWRIKNQVAVATKAKKYCELNNIEPRAVSPKLLVPLMEGASLEDEEILQDKWAILLSYLVDSDQNIQNHVFPYILGQISSSEFLILENVFKDLTKRNYALQQELQNHLSGYEAKEAELESRKSAIEYDIAAAKLAGATVIDSNVWKLNTKLAGIVGEIRYHKHRESQLKLLMEAPQPLPENVLKDFELSNIIRLGLAKFEKETFAESQSIDLSNREYTRYIDVDIELVSEEHHVLTELGLLFIQACTEKRAI